MHSKPISPTSSGKTPIPADIALKLAALSHPARVEILARIASCGGACSCKDVVACLDLAQSTVSQHLKILVDAGLLRYAVDRQRSRYEIDPVSLTGLSRQLAAFTQACCRPPVREN